jgi:peptidoglycan/LPS O-acetylase OafA/YrhL
MQQEIQDPQFQTTILIVILFLAVLSTLKRRKKDEPLFPQNITQEIKGFAILTIIFGHIGYFLDTQDKFLYPLSIASGIGVNLFLFLSGYGLTLSSLKKKLSLFEFFKKRLGRLFISMWIVIGILLFLDWSILSVVYERKTIIQNLFGFFPDADIYTSINSVLWYFSFILFYYIAFSIFTLSKKLLLISPIALFMISDYLLTHELPFRINPDVLKLYELHVYAFPLGIAIALLPTYIKLVPKISNIFSKIVTWLKTHNRFLNVIILSVLAYIFIYTSINSGIGEELEVEQRISTISTFSILLFFILKRFNTKFLEILGIFSYEIYLIHWPLVYRYDLFYKYLPASIATVMYILVLILLSWCLQKVTNRIGKLLRI